MTQFTPALIKATVSLADVEKLDVTSRHDSLGG